MKSITKILLITLVLAVMIVPAHALPKPGEEDISARSALNAIVEAKIMIDEMRDEEMNSSYVRDIWIEAKQNFQGAPYNNLWLEINESGLENKKLYLEILEEAQEAYKEGKRYPDYERARKQALVIKEARNKAFQLLDEMRALELKIADYEHLGVNVTEAKEKYKTAEELFKSEIYEEAETEMKDTDELLEAKRAELTLVNALKEASKTFLQKYWIHLLVTLLIFTGTGITTWKITARVRAKNKVENLKIELETLDKLMKKAQMERFSTGKLPETTYRVRMTKYREKISDIKGKLPVYEALARGEKPKKKKGEKRKKRFWK